MIFSALLWRYQLLICLACFSGCDSQAPPPATPINTSSTNASKTAEPRGASHVGNATRNNVKRSKLFYAPPVLNAIPEFQWKNAKGEMVRSEELRGSVSLFTFLTDSRDETTQQMLKKLAQFQRQTKNWPEASRIRLVTLIKNSSASEAKYMLDQVKSVTTETPRWDFCYGKTDETARIIDQGFRPVPSRTSPRISQQLAIVDAQGMLRGFYDLLTEDSFRVMLAELRGVLNEQHDSDHPVANISIPADLFYAPWMEDRRRDQVAFVESVAIEHRFRFEDHLESSGITFVNRVTPDSAKNWKLNHYDHGNGVAAADVDGDGWIDIYFCNQVGGNELWRNQGDGTFENITQKAGVAIRGRVSVSASFADIDNDGDPDLYVTTVNQGNVFFLNEGRGVFRDSTQDAGLELTAHSSSAEFFDYDRDGLLDLFVVNVGKFTTYEVDYAGDRERKEFPYFVGLKEAFAAHLFSERSETKVLYHNEGNGRFRNTTKETGLVDSTWSGDATPTDLNGDGWVDLYVLGMQGNDEYWQNMEGVRFERRSEQYFKVFGWGSMGVKSFDWNHDGRSDLFTTNMHADMWEEKPYGVGELTKAPANSMPESYLRSRHQGHNVFGNAFYQGGKSGLEEISDNIKSESYWPWGLSVADLNADGWDDAFITSSMNLHWRYHPNTLLLNDAGKNFVAAEFALGVEPRRDNRIAIEWYRLDCEGADKDHELSQGRRGEIVVWGARGTRGSVICDLDGDGDLDIITNEFNGPPQVLVSNLAQRNRQLHYLSIKLQGRASNRDALGARIIARAGDRTLYHTLDGQSGYLSQSSLPIYLGLGAAEFVDSLTIEWPSGIRQEVEGPITTNRTITIQEQAKDDRSS